MGRPLVYLHGSDFRRIGELTTVQEKSVRRSFDVEAASRPAQFAVSRDERLLPEIRSRQGPVVVIKSDEYPVPWVGRISRVRSSPGKPTVSVTCLSYETVLRHRFLGAFAEYSGPANRVMRQILGQLNEIEDTGILPGALDEALPPYRGALHFRSGLTALSRVREATGAEWWLDIIEDDSGLDIRLSAASYRDIAAQSTVTLREGGNMTLLEDLVDGEAATFVTTRGGRASDVQPVNATPAASSTNRLAPHGFPVEAPASLQGPAGRIERLYVMEDLREGDLVASAAASLLGRGLAGIPRSLTIAALPDAETWPRLLPGRVVRVDAPSAFGDLGYRGPVRILAVEPREEDGVLGLSVQLLEDAP